MTASRSRSSATARSRPRCSCSRTGSPRAPARRSRRPAARPRSSRSRPSRSRPSASSRPASRARRGPRGPGRQRLATRVRGPPQRVPGAGPPAPDPVRLRDPVRLQVPGPRPGSGRRPHAAGDVPRIEPDLRPARPVLRRRPDQLLGRGPGREPVHQRLDHHAADDRRGPVAAGPPARGRVRPDQDQPVHPVPVGADGPAPGLRVHGPAELQQRPDHAVRLRQLGDLDPDRRP